MTPEQYALALAELGELLVSHPDPAPESPQGQRLNELAALLEEYECEHFPELFSQ